MMTNWITCTLSDVGEIIGGATPSTKKEEYYSGDISWITPKDLSSFTGRYIGKGERNITEIGLNSCSAQLMPKGTVLFTSRAPIGYVAIAKKEVCTNQGFKSIVAKDNIDPLFLYYLLVYNKDNIEALGSGTTFKEVSGKTMKAVPVIVPSNLEEQKQIALLLDKLDSRIELNNKINDNLEQQLISLYDNFSSSESWETVLIENIAEKIALGPFGSNIKVSTFVADGVPVISGNHLRGKFLEEPSFNYITEEHSQKLKNSIVYPKDIVFTHAGNIGQVAMIPNDSAYSYYVISQRQFYLRCDVSKVLPEYVLMFFHSKEGQHELLSYANQTGVPSISQPATNLKKIKLPLPPIEEQIPWSRQVFPLIDMYRSNYQENILLTQLRDTLLPKLMSDKIDVSQVEV